METLKQIFRMCRLLISNQTHILLLNWDRKYDQFPRRKLKTDTKIFSCLCEAIKRIPTKYLVWNNYKPRQSLKQTFIFNHYLPEAYLLCSLATSQKWKVWPWPWKYSPTNRSEHAAGDSFPPHSPSFFLQVSPSSHRLGIMDILGFSS